VLTRVMKRSALPSQLTDIGFADRSRSAKRLAYRITMAKGPRPISCTASITGA
jgi:hypothetical protein